MVSYNYHKPKREIVIINQLNAILHVGPTHGQRRLSDPRDLLFFSHLVACPSVVRPARPGPAQI